MTINITLDNADLEFTGPVEDPLARWLLNDDVTIDGVHFHFEGIEVEVVDGIQRAKHDDFDDALACLHSAAGADGHFNTVELGGRHYVISITPSC